MQTTASTPKIRAERVRAVDAVPRAPTLFVHRKCRQVLDLSWPFKLTAVALVTAVVALALLIQ